MQTEIIKANSQKQSILGLFQNLKLKCKSKKDYDITVIVKQCNDRKRILTADIQDQKQQYKNERSKSLEKDQVDLNQDIQFSSMNLNESHRSSQSEQTVEEKKLRKLVNKLHIKRRDTAAIEQQEKQTHIKEKKVNDEAYKSQVFDRNKLNIEEKNIEQQQAMEQSGRYSFKVNNQQVKESSQTESAISAGENDSETGFLIQNYLNQAMEFVEKEKYNQLEDFLYNFKEKYTFSNMRSQTKWSLLMAHCKQGKLQFERAATNYNQVIETLKEYPTIIMVELGDIYNHLGLCFFQIQEWNKAITAYSSALNHYRSSKKCIQYANCITNLGVLYLEINYFVEAEKCLLMAYTIKHKQYDERRRQGLLSILFNLFDCNLKIRNYHQCDSILKNVSSIIKKLKQVDVRHQISYEIKKSKLYFMRDKFNEAFQHCQKALNILNTNKIDSKQIAQIFQLIGIIKQDMRQLQKSRIFFQKALKAIQKYVPSDSIQIQIIKKKIDILNQKIRRHASSKKKAIQMNPFAGINPKK